MNYFKLKFLLLFFALAVAIPPAWAEEVTVTTTISTTTADGTELVWTNPSLTFNFTEKPTSTNYSVETSNNARGLGTGAKTGTHVLTSDQEFTNVKNVTITASTNENGNSLSVNVGNTNIGTTDLTKGVVNKDFTFEASSGLNGNVIITINDEKKSVWIKTISVTYETGGSTTEKVATPTFSVAGGNYTTDQSVEISCATADATIYYTLDGTDPTTESTPYTGAAISISKTTTLKAIAMKDGMDNSTIASATYTFPTVVTNLADANILKAGTEFVYNGYAVVTHVVDNNQYQNADVWIRDNQGNAAYLYRAKPTGLAKGDVLKPGWSATMAEFNGLKELSQPTVETSGQAEVDPEILTEIKDTDVSKFVRLEGISTIGNDVQWYDKFGTDMTLDPNKTYNVEGIVGYYNRLQFYPISVEEVDAPAPDLAITLDPAEKSATAGENIEVTVTANTDAEVIYEYTCNPATATLTETATGFTITSATAGTVTVTVNALDEDSREATATGTYTFTAAPEPGVKTTYKKVTSTDQVTTGKYLIVYENDNIAFDGSRETLDGANNIVDVTITDGEIETDKDIYFTYDATAQTLKSASNKYIGQSSYANGLKQDEDANKYTNSITIDDGNAVITALQSGNDNQFTTLRFNSATGDTNYRFRYYKSGQQDIQLYKEVTGEPVVPELSVALDPAEKTYTVGDVAKIMVTVENGNDDTVVTYKINGEEKDYDAETGIVLPNDKAKKYTVEVYATDGDREATATGTYTFNAAPAFDITLTPNKEGNYTVGDNAVVTVAVDKYIGEDYLVTYTIGDSEEQIEYNAETGIVLPNDKAGDVTVKVYVTDGYDHEGEGTATATYHFDAAPAIVVTLTPAEGSYTVGTEVKVNVKIENTIGDYLATYTINDGEEQEFDGNDIVIPSDQIATVTLAVSVTDAYHDGVTTVTGQYVFSPMPVVAMPTFSLVAGSYTGPQQVTIYCATEGATISYSTDGGQTWTKGNTVNVDKDMTIMAKASKDGYTISETATGYYVIDIPEALPTDMPTFDGYYSVLNSGKYANIQGRKTLTFTDAPDAQAGTVIRLKSDNTGKVEVLRSQAADLQRYAYRAMDYVPDIVQIVVDKLGAEGEGHILGKDGLDAIMTKFDESFKPDLYIEKAGDNGYRIYGRTPSMQPVVDFYRENKDKVEAKLPDLVAFINSALAKLRNKANQAGMDGDNVFVDFDLKTIWTRMGGNLTDPEVDEMGFYRDVLNYKDNVWNFAYQTATFYLEKIKNTGTYTSLSEQLGEFAQYLDKIDQIHPDFKYYIVANEEVTKPDFISQGNADIINNAARTIWTIKERPNFTVNFPAENKYGNEYVTTLYTDFAYTLPEGVTAWAVTSVSDQGIGELTAIDGTTIAAQTPVLLKSTTAGDVATFGITTADGTAAPEGNLLVGPDYLIETYQIKTPEVVKMFEAIKTVLGENIYNDLVDKYGHLQFRTSGTVNNKYFWGLNEEEVKSCAEENPETGKKVKVVRSLGIKDDLLGFNDNEHVYTNKALLVSTEHSAINFSLRGDINKDGVISIIDVTALIDILLDGPNQTTYLEPTPSYPKGLDYEAADVNEEKGIEITDVTTLIDILLNMPDQPAQGSGN